MRPLSGNDVEGAPVRRLVVCCDGTWDTAEQMAGGVPVPTNVVRLFHALDQGDDQLCYYHPGVGTGPGLLNKIEGGSIGSGLSAQITGAYAWLAAHYRRGDAVCLFGFSRGAYTVRSLAGMIRSCGLPRIPAEPASDRWRRIDHLYDDVYRPDVVAEGDAAVPITFLGVWDTVGALGIPESLGLLKIVDDLRGHPRRFHDTRLGEHVAHARHAVAMDEQRGPFVPTLWTNLPVTEPGRTARQVWFPGDHCDVGGGHPQIGLSDGALRWMIAEAQACVADLRFRDDLVSQIRPDPRDVLHDDSTGLYRFLSPTPRPAPFLDPQARPAADQDAIGDVHVSACARQSAPPISMGDYRRGRVPEIGKAIPCDIYAARPWNWTGLYLTEGEYELSASGEWLDRGGPHDADGTREGRWHHPDLTHVYNAAAGWLQDTLKKLTHDDAVTFLGAPRRRDVPWMALLGAVATQAFTTDAGELLRYEQFPITPKPGILTVEPGRAGYLYAYANDAWGMYADNRGSLTMTITRRS